MVSMKRFYFGVGGGVGEFRRAVKDRNERERKEGVREGREFKELWEIGSVVHDDGRSNIREILKLALKINKP